MRRPIPPRPLLWSALAALAAAPGCADKPADCSAQIADGSATYEGKARGKKGDPKLPREATRDACRQRCAATKAPILDACVARCMADIEGAKLGAKTTCTDRPTS